MKAILLVNNLLKYSFRFWLAPLYLTAKRLLTFIECWLVKETFYRLAGADCIVSELHCC